MVWPGVVDTGLEEVEELHPRGVGVRGVVHCQPVCGRSGGGNMGRRVGVGNRQSATPRPVYRQPVCGGRAGVGE